MFLLGFFLLALLSISNNSVSEAFRTGKKLGSRRLDSLNNVNRLTVDESRLTNNNNNRRSADCYYNSSPTALQAAARFKNFEQVLDTFHTKPLIIYFSTKKCGPCQLMKKEIKTIQERVSPEMKLFSIDTEIYPSVGSRFAVASLPCLVVFHEGEVKLRLEGVNKAEEVVELVRTVQ